jgi:hypothetical protein
MSPEQPKLFCVWKNESSLTANNFFSHPILAPNYLSKKTLFSGDDSKVRLEQAIQVTSRFFLFRPYIGAKCGP